MNFNKLDDVRIAKKQILQAYGSSPEIVGIGIINQDDRGYAIKVNVSRCSSDSLNLPDMVDNVPIIVNHLGKDYEVHSLNENNNNNNNEKSSTGILKKLNTPFAYSLFVVLFIIFSFIGDDLFRFLNDIASENQVFKNKPEISNPRLIEESNNLQDKSSLSVAQIPLVVTGPAFNEEMWFSSFLLVPTN